MGGRASRPPPAKPARTAVAGEDARPPSVSPSVAKAGNHRAPRASPGSHGSSRRHRPPRLRPDRRRLWRRLVEAPRPRRRRGLVGVRVRHRHTAPRLPDPGDGGLCRNFGVAPLASLLRGFCPQLGGGHLRHPQFLRSRRPRRARRRARRRLRQHHPDRDPPGACRLWQRRLGSDGADRGGPAADHDDRRRAPDGARRAAGRRRPGGGRCGRDPPLGRQEPRREPDRDRAGPRGVVAIPRAFPWPACRPSSPTASPMWRARSPSSPWA